MPGGNTRASAVRLGATDEVTLALEEMTQVFPRRVPPTIGYVGSQLGLPGFMMDKSIDWKQLWKQMRIFNIDS